MHNLNEVEASRIIGEIARERAAAGKPRLTERQAAQILRAHRQEAGLPTMTPEALSMRIPEPRPTRRTDRTRLASL